MRHKTIRILTLALALGVAGAACAKEKGLGTGGGGSPVFLQVETSGGFLPREYALRTLPEYTMTADGLVVVQGAQIEIFPPPALPSLTERTISAAAIEKIIAEAEAAGLAGPDKSYKNDMIADAATTTFIYHDADGGKHTISAYALDIGDEGAPAPEGQSDEDREARKKLAALRQKLLDLPSWIDKMDLGDEKSYDFTSLRIFVQPYTNTNADLPQQEKAWPLSTPLASFGAAFEGPSTRCGVVDGADLGTFRKPAQESNSLTPWKSDGKQYLLILRPLLPGESGCPTTA